MKSHLGNKYSMIVFVSILLLSLPCRFALPSTATPESVSTEPNDIAPTSTDTSITTPISTGNDAIPQNPDLLFPGFISFQIPKTKIIDNPTSLIKLSEWRKESGFEFMTFLPNQQLMANNREGLFISSWDFNTGHPLYKFESGKSNYTGITDEIYYSSDSNQIASLYRDDSIRVWDINTGKSLHSFETHKGRVAGVGYPLDKWLVAIDTKENAIIELWNLGTNELIRSIETGHKNEIYAAFSNNGQLVATSSRDDKTARVWNVQTGQLLYELSDQYFRNVETLFFSPNSEQLVLVDASGYSNVWDMSTGKLLYELSSDLFLGPSPVYSADGNLIAIRILLTDNNHNGKYRIAIINSSDGKQLAVIDCDSENSEIIGFSPDGKLLLVNSNETLQIWGSSE